ncbi:YlcI/YnfO family protein [Burkholderia sp. JPY481]
MKSATFPSVRVEPELRAAAEDVLQEGENLASSPAEAKQTGDYVSADDVLAGLERRLGEAKAQVPREGDDSQTVTVLAVRHQLEDHYH